MMVLSERDTVMHDSARVRSVGLRVLPFNISVNLGELSHTPPCNLTILCMHEGHQKEHSFEADVLGPQLRIVQSLKSQNQGN